MPNPVIKGSFASPESIAYAAYQKFVMGVPLYRQEQDWLRQGIELSRQTMANWLIHSTQCWLNPIVAELKRRLLGAYILHADETTIQVLREPGKSPQSKSYLWCYRTSGDASPGPVYTAETLPDGTATGGCAELAGNELANKKVISKESESINDRLASKEHEPIVIAEYKPNRKGSNASEFLANFSGYLHTDGYDAYHKLPERITVVGCWAHVRRKWDEALKIVPKEERENCVAMIGKRYCDKMFAIERSLANIDANARYTQRLAQLAPLMDEFLNGLLI